MKYFSIVLIAVYAIFNFSCSDLLGIKEVAITIDSESDLTLYTHSKIKFAIYGYDTSIADQAASLLNESVMDLDEIPHKFIILCDESWNSKITPVALKKYNYYIAIKTDINNDSIVNAYDYGQDYIKTPPYFTSSLANLTQTIFIKQNSTNASNQTF
ncbi:MAG: hypothetical protein A2Y33_13275 [Spirochaetes bacterium GWF1_51_8]|nr:MAG: hypothetical protein A2Y33_13275 [Spirochaetes bacterium GWF1_51_8]